MNIEDLASPTELAKHFRTTRQTLSNWRDRYSDFPRPVAVFSRVPVYVTADVVEWYQRHFGMKRYEDARAPLPG